nr:hypothetical protein [Tanacetum cinerariifolium]
MPSKDNLYNGRKGIGFENPSYFEKAKDLRPTLYDEKVIGLGYTLMFLTHSDKALEIEKFKRYRENKIEFACDYGNLNASYVNEKINFEDDYFQDIINPDFEKIDSSFQQTSSLKPYVPNIVQIYLWIIDSGGSKHMTGNRALLKNFVEKFLGTVRFGNNDFAVIAGYGDNKTLAKFFDEVGITQQFSAARTPQQNGIVERRNRTLVESARTMLTFANLPSFLWPEAIATACFTQNPSIIHKCFDKTPYELINKRKLNIKFFRVFGCRCYLLNDYKDVGKLKAKGDIEVFVGIQKNLLLSEFTTNELIIKSSTTNVKTSINEEVFHEVFKSFQGESSLCLLNDDVQQSPKKFILPQTNTQLISSNMIPIGDEASTSHNVFNERLEDAYFDASTSFYDPSNVYNFYQPYPHEKKWTKDHPLHKIIGDPKLSVRTRGQLVNSCLFSCLLSSVEPANVAEALRDADWVSAMQEELDQFTRLKVWRLVPRPKGKSVIKTKWIFKNKKDKSSLVIRNKARLVPVGYSQLEGIDYDETFAPVLSVSNIQIMCML